MPMEEEVIDFEARTELLEALASPRRLHILSLIAGRDRVTNVDVKEAVGISQPNVSFHLKKLHRVGIVERSKEGRSKIYEINRDMLEEKGIDLGKLINASVA